MDWLRIHVSNLCNFKCPNCHVFELGENNLPNRVMSQEIFDLSIEQYLKVMKLMGNKETMISIYGGETLANKKVIKVGVERFGNFYDGITLNWVINTNGSLLKEDDVLFFKEHNVEIHISVDGSEDIHNISRPTHKGKGTFHMVTPALELIKKHQAPAQINSYMMPSNYMHLEDIVDIAHEYSISKIYLDQFYNLDMISHQVGMERYRKVFYYAVHKGIAVSGPWAKVIKAHEGNKKRREDLSRRISLDVNMDGTFYTPIFTSSKKAVRHVKDLVASFESGLWNEFVSQSRKLYDEKCAGCSLIDSCYGSAIEQVHYHMGTEADPEVSCHFFRDWCQFLLRPVYLKDFGKFDVLSMIELDKTTSLTSEIDNAINSLENILWPLKEKIRINIGEYPEEFRLASGQPYLPAWVKATTSGRQTLHHLGVATTPALVHELTHLFIAQRNLNLPKWFVEGLCEFTQNDYIDRPFVINALKTKNLFELLKIDRNQKLQLIELDQNPPAQNQLYQQAKAFVAHLHSQLGQTEFHALLTSCQEVPLEKAIDKHSPVSLESHIQQFSLLYS